VADVRPFPALAYDEGQAGPLATLVSPPYDVISPEQRAGYLAASPHNAVHLILPELPYDEVAGLLAGWREAGVVRRADAPEITAWTQTFTLADGIERERRTLLAAVGLEPYEARVVRPHERTHAGPKEDRLRLTRAVRTNLSPVFGLYPDPEGAAWAAVAGAVARPPDAEVTDDEGTVHRFWRIADPDALAGVTAAMADRWILIADGHHRYETALAYREERREAGAGDGPHDRVMMGLTALDDPGLVVLPTHRVLGRWPDDAADAFERRPVEDLDALLAALAAAPPDRPAVGLVLPDGAALLIGPEHAADATPAERLDVAVIENRILLPGLGADQAALAHEGVLTYVKDPAEAWRLVRDGAAAASLVLRPIAKADIAAVAEAAEVMPQKSTYFFPKLLTGVAFHALGDG
jgi:uncharacterized protein (DUF1015 family)